MLKNGKLFGKINIIDLLAILVVLVAIAAVAVFLFMPKSGNDTLIMKFRIEEVDEFVATHVHVGDELYDDTYQLNMGIVTDVELDDSISFGMVNDGVYSRTTKEGYYSMIITGEVSGRKTKLGAEIGGKKYGIGHSFVLRAGDAKLYLRVYDIQLKDDSVDGPSTVAPTDMTVPVVLSFYTPEVESFTVDNIKVGDAASDAVRKSGFGSVDSIEIGEALDYCPSSNGGVTVYAKEGYSSAVVTVTAMGVLSDEGIKIDGKVYSVGDEIELRAGSSRMTVKICSVGQKWVSATFVPLRSVGKD